MWQSSVSVSEAETDLLDAIEKTVRPVVLNAGGICLRDTVADRVRLSMAVRDDDRDAVGEAYSDAVAVSCGEYYKERFIRASVKLPILPPALYNAYVRALVMFDRAYETELIRSLLPEGETLTLDGFYRFRMGEIRERWRDVCELAVQSFVAPDATAVCIELIRFLLSTCEYGCEYARVERREDGFRVESDAESPFEPRSVPREMLVAEIVRRNPKCVIADGDAENRSETDWIRAIFEGNCKNS